MVVRRGSVTFVAGQDTWLGIVGSGEVAHHLLQGPGMDKVAEVMEAEALVEEVTVEEVHPSFQLGDSMGYATIVAREGTRRQTAGCWNPMLISVQQVGGSTQNMILVAPPWSLY